MPDLTIEEFCNIHYASDECKLELQKYQTLQDCWNNTSDIWTIWLATRMNVLTRKDIQLFAVYCCRQQQPNNHEEYAMAVDIVEKCANGEAFDWEQLMSTKMGFSNWSKHIDVAITYITSNYNYSLFRVADLAARTSLATNSDANKVLREMYKIAYFNAYASAFYYSSAVLFNSSLNDNDDVKFQQADWLRKNCIANWTNSPQN
jgi:hypothetical protein